MLHFFARRMKEARDKDESNQGGFTLIELLVVVIIIGILAAIAIPTFLNQRKNGYEAQTKSDIRNAVTNAESIATTNNGSYSTVTAANVGTNGASKNTTLTVANVAAGEYCIKGENKTDASIDFYYLKSVDEIKTGTACT